MLSKTVKFPCYNAPMWYVRAVFWSVIVVSFLGILPVPVLGNAHSDTMTIDQPQPCVTAQACFESRDLSVVVTQFPDSIWASRAHFLVGTQLIEHGDPAGRSSLEHLSDKLPLVADYVQWSLANSLFIEDNFRQAALAYRLISQHFHDSPLIRRARYFEGVSWYRFGDCKSAQITLAVVFDGHPAHADVASGLRPASGLLLAYCYLQGGNKEDAADILWRVWTDMPHLLREEDRQAALTAFGKLGISSEHATIDQLWRRASAFFDAGQYSKAADAFTVYLRVAITQNHIHSVDGQIKRGIALVKTRRLAEARIVLENAIKHTPSDDVTREAYVWLARTYLRLGDGEQLQSLSQQVATLSFPPSTHVSILYFLGLWQEDQQGMVEARGTYQCAMETAIGVHAGVWTRSVLWQLAWINFRAGNYVEAVQAFDRMLEDPSGREIQRALYWKAIALERLGKAKNSRVAFLDLCENFPHGYYCQNTRLYLGMPPSGEIRLPEQGFPAPTDRSLDKVQEMIILGLTNDAMMVLQTVLRDNVLDPGQYLALSQQLQSAGDTYRSLRLIKRRFANIIRGGHDGVPSLFWDLAYPKTYMPVIRDAIAENQTDPIDPYVIAALIREESSFDTNARSKTGALGLMQLIPQTADQIARSRAVKSFDPGMLLDPHLNIQFGVSYFRSLLTQFDGNLVSSIAGYNAGPVAVARWRLEMAESPWDKGGNVSDEEKFVESIPYKETRNYVKRVLQTYREYHRVNGTDCRVSFLDKHC